MNMTIHERGDDLNLDGKIDIQDVAAVAKVFGTCHNHSRWDPRADVNQDSKVDLKDIASVAKDFGKTQL